MAGANSNIQLTNLDFDSIKSNFITFLQSQSAFKDYNFTGSSLNALLDVLSYNTQYNAYYLNMVANEMFLDSATQRGSVVSHAKMLNYTPKSAIAPTATVDVIVTNVNASSLTLPSYMNFSSAAIDGVNYTFVNPDSYTSNTDANNTVTFSNVEIKQGVVGSYSYTVNSTTNPISSFQIPDASIDTTTIKVLVQKSISDTTYDIYNLVDDYFSLNGESKVFFLQEAVNGNYEIYFGDGILGKKLSDGNIVLVNYLSTEGSSGAGANSFVLMDTIGGYPPSQVLSVTPASSGGDKETLDSIKFQAPKAFAAQGRAVSKNDYITAIQQNKLGISFDAVNVWGGEENDPPVYGQVFISVKPKNAYGLTYTQKQRLVTEVIKPISVLTVTPTMVDPDYTYITLNVNVVFDASQTTLTSSEIQAGVTQAIKNFASTTLNTFNSTFNTYELLKAIQGFSPAILSSDFKMSLQKRFLPDLINSATYTLNYDTPIKPGTLLTGVSSSPGLMFRDATNLSNIISGVFIEEVPSSTNGIESISIVNPGFGYTALPTITILGDGTGATAHAVVENGQITGVVIDNAGSGYTSALAVITNGSGDSTGQLANLVVNLQGRYGTLRTYYNDSSKVKTILNQNIGTIDYQKGLILLNSFNPINVDNALGQLAVTVNPVSSIISSSYNKIITVDEYDAASIVVNVVSK